MLVDKTSTISGLLINKLKISDAYGKLVSVYINLLGGKYRRISQQIVVNDLPGDIFRATHHRCYVCITGKTF